MRINRINGHKSMLDDLNKYIENLINTNNEFREQLHNWNKDDEIQKLKKENENIIRRSIHIMSEKEMNDSRNFREYHYKICKGNTVYTFEGTGIGTAVTVKCTRCNVEKNITDTGNW